MMGGLDMRLDLSDACLNQLRLEWTPFVSPELQSRGAAGNRGEED